MGEDIVNAIGSFFSGPGLIIILMVVMLVIMIVPQRRREKRLRKCLPQ